MTLIEAMHKAADGNVVERKYQIPNGMTFTKWGKICIDAAGTFLMQGWGNALKLEDLEADNWEVQK